MEFKIWLAYLAAAWLIALSPGAGAVLSMSHGLSYGVRQATATILGLQVGLGLILLTAGGGVGALLLASATAFAAIKILGAAYLVWLGVKQWRAPVAREPLNDPERVGAPGFGMGCKAQSTAIAGAMASICNAADRPKPGCAGRDRVVQRFPNLLAPEGAALEGTYLSTGQRFVRGLLTNTTNPKGIVFMVAVLPQFISSRHPLWSQLAVLLVTTLCVDVTVMHGYALLAASLRRWLASPRARRIQNRVTGGILMAMGASLTFVSRAAKAG